jgi:hypothetical protein
VKTFSTKKTDFTRDWIVVDAKDMPLGRVASQVAARLRGKHKPIYTETLSLLSTLTKSFSQARSTQIKFTIGTPDTPEESKVFLMVSFLKQLPTKCFGWLLKECCPATN